MITWEAIVAILSGVITIVTIVKYYNKMHEWYLKQTNQDEEIQHIKTELALLTYGTLACLKGLQEQGCNGPVTEAINKIEKHLNLEAHR